MGNISFTWLIFLFVVFLSTNVGSIEPLEGHREVAACLHRFMEKDFLAIAPIMFPSSRNRNQRPVLADKGFYSSTTLANYFDQDPTCESRYRQEAPLADGQTLTQNCRSLSSIELCLHSILIDTKSSAPFFRLRDLWLAVHEVIQWLCGHHLLSDEEKIENNYYSEETHEDVVNIRQRFLVLIESVECLECVRTSELFGCGYWEPFKQNNLWARILRLELDPSACPVLSHEFYCMSQALRQHGHFVCGEKATHLYGNLTQVFLNSWCYQSNLFSNATYMYTCDFYLFAVWVFCLHVCFTFLVKMV